MVRARGRIPLRTFAEELLEDEDRKVNVYDGRLSTPSLRGRRADSYLSQLTSALAAGFAPYARNELGVSSNLPYLVLNEEVFRQWRSDGGGRLGSEPAGVADDLTEALVLQPSLRTLVAHGAHDLVTPYFTSAYLMDQLVTDPETRKRVAVKLYPGGHMFYTARRQLGAVHGRRRGVRSGAHPCCRAWWLSKVAACYATEFWHYQDVKFRPAACKADFTFAPFWRRPSPQKP